jgi:hypothetical protein
MERGLARMSKEKLTAEEKERLRREDLERVRANFLKTRPETDKALESSLRQQTGVVPLSPQDLVSPEEPEIPKESPVVPTSGSSVQLPTEPVKPQEAAPKGPRFPTATVASPASEVLFKELAQQIRAFRPASRIRRITVSASDDVFSRVSHLHFVERVGKVEILSFLVERYVPRDRPEKLSRFLAREIQDEDQARHLTFFEDSELAARLDWLKASHGIATVAAIENIVLHAVPPAPFIVPPLKRRRSGLAWS